MYSSVSAGEWLMVAIYLAAGEESMAAEVVHNNHVGTPFRSFLYHTSVRKPRHHWLFAHQLSQRAHMLDYLLRYQSKFLRGRDKLSSDINSKVQALPSDQFDIWHPWSEACASSYIRQIWCRWRVKTLASGLPPRRAVTACKGYQVVQFHVLQWSNHMHLH